MRQVLLLILPAALLAACGETDQSLASGNTGRADTPAWQGAKNPYLAPNWTPGDKTAWDTQMRRRVQYQNEYVKVE